MKYDANSIQKRKKIEKRIKWIIGIGIVILLYHIILLAISYYSKTEHAGILGYKAFHITTSSMEPTLSAGDIIIVKKVKEKDLKIGDIITFKNDGERITHRIIEKEETGQQKYITKGDNNTLEDNKKVAYSEIEGVSVLKIPFLGKIVSFLENQVFVLIVLLIILICYWYKIGIEERKEIRREKKKKVEEYK